MRSKLKGELDRESEERLRFYHRPFFVVAFCIPIQMACFGSILSLLRLQLHYTSVEHQSPSYWMIPAQASKSNPKVTVRL